MNDIVNDMPEMSLHLLFFLSALGVFNGLLLAGYIAITKREQLTYLFLSALLVMVSLRVGKSVLYFFYPELDKVILQIGLSACFLIGPMAYFYTYYTINQYSSLSPKQRLHLSTLVAIPLVFGLAFPYQAHIDWWTAYVYKIVNYNWLVYVVGAWVSMLRRYGGIKPMMRQDCTLLLSVNVGVGAIWLAYFTSSMTSYITGALSFSFILYITIALLFLTKPKTLPKPKPYQSKQFDQDTVDNLSQKLQQTMTENEYFCEPLLAMPNVASKMGISVAQLSQLLNDNFDKSFNTYVNELRIEKAKGLLTSGQNMTMEVIAERCGYNSMSTFYSAFKKIVDVTPAKYRQQYQ